MAWRPVASTSQRQETVAVVPSLFSTVSVFVAAPVASASVHAVTFAGRQSSVPSSRAVFSRCSSSLARSSWNDGVRASCVGPVSEASRRHVTSSLKNQ